jgi:DNA-binding transcriptional LysR family regulator
MTNERGDLELSLLRTFLAVVRYGSISRTATAVAKTQPAVSQQMLRLEKIAGRKLLYRGQDGVKLTSHGAVLVAYANRAIHLNEKALARLQAEAVSGQVRLGVSEETALAGLTPVLQRFQRTHPDVELKLTVAEPSRLERLLAQDSLDFIIGDPAQIAGEPVIEWGSHLTWLAGTDLLIDPLKPLPLVLCKSTGMWRDEIVDSMRVAGWNWRVVFEGASLDATLAAVESGFGVAALPRGTKRNAGVKEIKHGSLPLLPKVHFGMFRGRTANTKARGLMETALVSSFRAAIGRGGGHNLRMCRHIPAVAEEFTSPRV